MIASAPELQVSVRQLRIMETGLRALRDQLESSSPALFEVSSQAFIRRITSLREEITRYLAQDPSAVSLVLRQLDQMKEWKNAPELSPD